MDTLRRFLHKLRINKVEKSESSTATIGTLSCHICLEDIKQQSFIKIGCKHRVHKRCLKNQLDYIPKRGEQMLKKYGQCGVCSTWITEKKKLSSKEWESVKELKRYYELWVDWENGNHRVFRCFTCAKLFHEKNAPCADDVSVPADSIRCQTCVNVCSIHGTEFLSYKCRYCCNPSTYHCGPGNHMCEDCHSSQTPQPCVGLAGGCKGDHEENGTASKCLGCSMCFSLPRQFLRPVQSSSNLSMNNTF